MADEVAALDFSVADFDAWESMSLSSKNAMHDSMMAVATDRMGGNFRERRALARLERNGFLARLATRKAYAKFAETAADPGDWQSFMEWLIANWESILKMILSIIALF
jgi:hypothetical protein